MTHEQQKQPAPSFTGWSRRRKTRLAIRIKDAVARSLITIGGIGTIVAVSTVCLFLIWVVVPLFRPAQVHQERSLAVPWSVAEAGAPIHVGVDEHQVMGWALFRDGTLQAFRIDTGEAVGTVRLFESERQLTAWSILDDIDDIALGFADGSVQLGSIGFENRFVAPATIPDELRAVLASGEVIAHEDGLLRRTQVGIYRLLRVNAKLQPPAEMRGEGAVKLIGHTVTSRGTIFIGGLKEDGTLTLNEAQARRNVLTRETTYTLSDSVLPYDQAGPRGTPAYLLVSGLGDMVYLAHEDGSLIRFDTRDRRDPRVAEEVDLLGDLDRRLTAMGFLIGRTTIAVGDSTGCVSTWFRAHAPGVATSDGHRLIRAHEFEPTGSAVRSLSASMRSRLLAIGHADGTARLFHTTSDKELLRFRGLGRSVESLRLTPRNDALLTAGADAMRYWVFDLKHPAVTRASIAGRVHYEGYAEPRFIWQASSGTDDFEPKYGLWPLVFGTLKATFYSMLFGLPLALLAAIYTSEFLHPKTKAKVKPAVEMMAALPSVVLGFIAAMVIAPFVEHVVPGVVLLFVTVPLTVLLGGYAWQMLPQTLKLRMEQYRLPLLVIMVLLGMLVALGPGPMLGLIGLDRIVREAGWGWIASIPGLGRLVERFLFSGDVRLWLDGQIGGAIGGWMVLFLPLSALLTAFLISRLITPRMRDMARGWSRLRAAAMDVVKFVAGIVATIGVALLLSSMLAASGFDPRGSYLDTYVQRNAMVVGFVMGFAIVPIIYTISEDALSAVPEHLRSAALGCGATQWQTAVRVILPTAMSGLFSATMIGLGRAVGETMIILMAAGNTAVLDINIFNGMRTLASNIAIELSEAPINGTHYRMLFLAALTLFAMTFVLNTVAEVIRLRFRKRAFQL